MQIFHGTRPSVLVNILEKHYSSAYFTQVGLYLNHRLSECVIYFLRGFTVPTCAGISFPFSRLP